MRCPKSNFPIMILVFYEYDFIVHVIQGLTLSTASLVYLSKSMIKSVKRISDSSIK